MISTIKRWWNMIADWGESTFHPEWKWYKKTPQEQFEIFQRLQQHLKAHPEDRRYIVRAFPFLPL